MRNRANTRLRSLSDRSRRGMAVVARLTDKPWVNQTDVIASAADAFGLAPLDSWNLVMYARKIRSRT